MGDSVKVTLANMVDLALCTPEVGAVNFNILRQLLLMMLQQLGLTNTTVNISGQEYAVAIQDVHIEKGEATEAPATEKKVRVTESKESDAKAKGTKAERRSRSSSKSPTPSKSLSARPATPKSPTPGATGATGAKDSTGAKAATVAKGATGAKDSTGAKGDAAGTRRGASEDSARKPSREDDYRDYRDSASGPESVDEEPAMSAVGSEGTEVSEDVSSLRGELNSLRKDVDQLIEEIRSVSEFTEKVPFEALYNSVKEIDDLKSKLEELTLKLSEKSVDQEDEETGDKDKADPVKEHLHELDEKLNTLNDQLQGMDANFTSQIEGLVEQIGALECDVGRLMEHMNTEEPEGDAMAQDFTGLGELQSRLQQLQSDMEHVNQVTTKLMDDEEERQLHYEALVEQVEVLKMVKADREVVEDALAEKADQVVVNRKVSHEQFDNACDDLARGLDEAFTKLCQQETIWKNALDDVQNEIGLKLDKVELTPLRDYIQQRLKILQDKIKALAARKELEAAGTKKFLRDVNCISCDKDVIMKRKPDIPLVPIQPSLPPARSIRPYVTYELDKLRHQQKKPMGKNLIQLEDMEQEYDKKQRKEKPDEEQEHLVNRYCGGSHTVIAPHQRVLRAGQTTQPTPEALGYTEISIRGTDGQLYLGQEMALKTGRKPDVTEATQTSESLMKTPPVTGKSSKSPAKSPKSPKIVRQGSRNSKVAFTDPHQENAAQGASPRRMYQFIPPSLYG